MPKRIVPLTDTKIRTIKATEKAQKLFDGGGLFLHVSPTGGKLWRLKYRLGVSRNSFQLVHTPKFHLPMRGSSESRLWQ